VAGLSMSRAKARRRKGASLGGIGSGLLMTRRLRRRWLRIERVLARRQTARSVGTGEDVGAGERERKNADRH
jgi:hypothetical protein